MNMESGNQSITIDGELFNYRNPEQLYSADL